MICIRPRDVINTDTNTNTNTNPLAGLELMEVYEKIIGSFNNPKTKEFIETYFGNGAINTTELKYIIPIYL